ncbi:hypothetical protein HZ326_27125, partial [Fusarium oxysporum f. sp. albedinis]
MDDNPVGPSKAEARCITLTASRIFIVSLDCSRCVKELHVMAAKADHVGGTGNRRVYCTLAKGLFVGYLLIHASLLSPALAVLHTKALVPSLSGL